VDLNNQIMKLIRQTKLAGMDVDRTVLELIIALLVKNQHNALNQQLI